MALNVSEISTSMLNAALGALKEKGPEIKGYAETEFKKLAETLAMIEKMRLTGAMTEEQAQLHLQIQKNATRTESQARRGGATRCEKRAARQ